jgi:hypothetical protein
MSAVSGARKLISVLIVVLTELAAHRNWTICQQTCITAASSANGSPVCSSLANFQPWSDQTCAAMSKEDSTGVGICCAIECHCVVPFHDTIFWLVGEGPSDPFAQHPSPPCLLSHPSSSKSRLARPQPPYPLLNADGVPHSLEQPMPREVCAREIKPESCVVITPSQPFEASGYLTRLSPL